MDVFPGHALDHFLVADKAEIYSGIHKSVFVIGSMRIVADPAVPVTYGLVDHARKKPCGLVT